MAPPPALGVEIFSRGFRFLPTPSEAVTYYLPRLVAGTPLHNAVRPVIHHADVYACAPADLARHFRPLPRTGDRFFFTPGAKRARGTGAAAREGSWHAQNTTDIIKGRGRRGDGDGADDAKVGELRKLRYKKSGGVYTDWLMDEYSCTYSVAAGDGESGQFVLCKMYVSPRAAPTSAAHKESVAYFSSFTLQAPPPPAAVVMQKTMPMQSPHAAVVMQKKMQMKPPPAAAVVMQMQTKPPPAAVVMQRQMQPAPAAAPKKRPAAPPMTSPPCAKRMRRAPVVQPAGGNLSFSSMPPPPQPSCSPPPVVPTRWPLAAVGKMPLAPPRQPPLAPTLSSFTAVRNMPLAPPQPTAPRRGSTTPSSATQPSLASAPPAPIRPPLAAVRTMSSAPPQLPCAPPHSSTTPLALATQPSPASAPHPAPPVPIRPAMQPHRSPVPMPGLPTPPVARVPLQVPVQLKQRTILDPFEAADEAEDQTAAAPPHPPPAPAAATTPALQDQDEDEDDWADLDKALDFDD